MIFYSIHKSFEPSIWSVVGMKDNRPRMFTGILGNISSEYLMKMTFDYPDIPKRELAIKLSDYNNLIEVIKSINLNIFNGENCEHGMDGTGRQIAIITGYRDVCFRWWENDMGKWDDLRKISNWFTNIGVA